MSKKSVLNIIGGISLLLGSFALLYVSFPILSHEIEARSRFASHLSPVPEDEKYKIGKAGSLDYTKASNWFIGTLEEDNFKAPNIRFYTLSIPKLKIKNATVSIGGEDLTESLIQYPGTALPGKRGNAAVFGHSILPQFYNPKDYLAIFSKLPTLKENDQIEVSYDGIVYEYLVEDMFEVKPTDVQILAQNTSSSYLTLVTCTPPGHPLRPKRLVVRAKLAPFGGTVGAI